MDEIRNFSSHIHNRRLETLYTDYADMIHSSLKISDEEIGSFIKMVRARLEMAKADGQAEENLSAEGSDQIKGFMELTDDPRKRVFIFGEGSQDKLIELGDVKAWVQWLNDTYDQEKKELSEILEKELNRPSPEEENTFIPKWDIKLKIITPSHSVRANLLTEFNQKSATIKLAKGGDNHTLIVNLILGQHVQAPALFGFGWMVSRIFVAALNVAIPNGLFGWNTVVDRDKFYDKITDLENKKEVSATLNPRLELNWPKNSPVLDTQALHLSRLVNTFFLKSQDTADFEPINDYIMALGMLAKSDIHLRLEVNVFMLFFHAFCKALTLNDNYDPQTTDIKELGYKQLENMISGREYFDETMNLANGLNEGESHLAHTISLTQVIAMKNYCSIYLLTLAVRDYRNDKTALLVNLNDGKTTIDQTFKAS